MTATDLALDVAWVGARPGTGACVMTAPEMALMVDWAGVNSSPGFVS
jgi:hypothetical protein